MVFKRASPGLNITASADARKQFASGRELKTEMAGAAGSIKIYDDYQDAHNMLDKDSLLSNRSALSIPSQRALPSNRHFRTLNQTKTRRIVTKSIGHENENYIKSL